MANNISNRVNKERSTLSSFLPNRDDRWVKWSVKLCGWFLAVITVIPVFSIVAFAKANDALKKRKVTSYPAHMNPFSETAQQEQEIRDTNSNEDEPSQLVGADTQELIDGGVQTISEQSSRPSRTDQEQEIRDTNSNEDEASQPVEADTQELIDKGVQTISAQSSRPSRTDFEQSNELSRKVEYLYTQVDELSRKVLNLEEEKKDLKKQNVNLEQEKVDLKREIEELKESNPSKPSYPWEKHQKTTAERAELSSRKHFSVSVAASKTDRLTADQASQRSRIRDLVHIYKRIRVREGINPDQFCEKLSSILFDAISKNKKMIKSYQIDVSGKHVKSETPEIYTSLLNGLFHQLSVKPKGFRQLLKSYKAEIALFTSPEAKRLFKNFLTKSGGSSGEDAFEIISNRFCSILFGLYVSGKHDKERQGIPPLIVVLNDVKSTIQARITKRERKGVQEPLP